VGLLEGRERKAWLIIPYGALQVIFFPLKLSLVRIKQLDGRAERGSVKKDEI